jgi:hypothetical protein
MLKGSKLYSILMRNAVPMSEWEYVFDKKSAAFTESFKKMNGKLCHCGTQISNRTFFYEQMYVSYGLNVQVECCIPNFLCNFDSTVKPPLLPRNATLISSFCLCCDYLWNIYINMSVSYNPPSATVTTYSIYAKTINFFR